MELMNAEKINKISMSTQAQKQKLEEKNIIDVEIEKETYNIVIAKRAKALMRKQEIPQKIMNNSEIMESKKAGFIFNPLSAIKQPLNGERYNEEAQNLTTEKQPLNESVITKSVNEEKQKEPLNDSVKRIDFSEYSDDDKKLIDLLWKGATVKRTEQLETRDNILKVIGNNKTSTTRLSKLYQKLLKDRFIYKKIGYFSNVDLD